MERLLFCLKIDLNGLIAENLLRINRRRFSMPSEFLPESGGESISRSCILRKLERI